MAQLTEELFPELQSRASWIFQQQEAKEALILGRELEQALPQLADNQALFQKCQTLTFQLKWLGLPLMQNEKEYTELFQHYFLEGLTMPDSDLNGPTQLVVSKITSMLGIGVVEFLNGILSALSENKQKIGREAILIAGEKTLSQPTIKNWLLNFIRSAPNKQALNEIAVSDYLFNNANTAKLLPQDKDRLGRTLIFFCDFQQVNQSLAALEKQLLPIETTTVPRAMPRGDSPKGEEFYGTPTPSPTITQKTLRQLAQDNKDALNQNLTSAPIKVTDFDQPVRPTIKNWLVDYVKIKGAGHHESLARSDYLSNSPNAKDLPAEERSLVAAILRAYDDDLPLPVNETDQTILLEKLTVPELSRQTQAEPKPLQSRQTTPYREPISQEDLSGPLKQTPAKPAPRLSGNIIDLKDLGE